MTMGWIALLAAAFSNHPLLSVTLVGVTITLISVIMNVRRRT
jgi:hypothetical protein